MPNYKLMYFNGRGRAESCRLTFAAAGVAYEDIRMTPEEWQKFKPNTKFGQMPILEVDGKRWAQSRAIMNYLGKEFGLYPSNNEEALSVDEIVHFTDDYFTKRVQAIFAKADEKESKMRHFEEEDLPKYLADLEKLLKLNCGGKSFFVGNKLTVADIAVFDFLHNFDRALDPYPVVKSFMERVGNIPGIKAWVEKRPKSQF